MRMLLLALVLLAGPAFAACEGPLNYRHRLLTSTDEVDLCSYQGQVVLVVNTASQCGFTGQFKDLEALYQRYREQGLVVLGFPSADFFQEHKNEADTAQVCYLNYGVTFPMFATSSVRGKDANALFKALAKAQGAPGWNFNKYLIGRDGQVLQSFGARVKPLDSVLEQSVEKALAE